MISVDTDSSLPNLLLERTEAAELLQWWHRWQVQMLRQEADYIRNTLMQEVFAIRRHLETSDLKEAPEAVEVTNAIAAAAAVNTDAEARYLDKLTKLYALLEQLSDRLEPPYGHEDLPLALRHAAAPWHQHLPITLDLPQAWDSEPAIQVRLLIAVVNMLCLALTSSAQRPQSCHIVLAHPLAQAKEMTIAVTYGDLPPPALIASTADELIPIFKTFQLMTQGTCAVEMRSRACTWILRWPPYQESAEIG